MISSVREEKSRDSARAPHNTGCINNMWKELSECFPQYQIRSESFWLGWGLFGCNGKNMFLCAYLTKPTNRNLLKRCKQWCV